MDCAPSKPAHNIILCDKMQWSQSVQLAQWLQMAWHLFGPNAFAAIMPIYEFVLDWFTII